MEKFEVILEKSAENDLLNIFSYICDELKEPATAEKIYISIKRSILSLSELLYSYNVISEEPFRTMKIRKIPVENYIAFYYVDSHSRCVHVIRVLYSRREWQSFLSL